MDLSNIIILATEAVQNAAGSGVMEEAAGHAQEADLLGTLGINWKLFIAQIINFGIVLFVLWKWVFGPIGKALEDRREKVEKSLRDAREIEERVQKFEVEHEERVRESRKEAESIIQKASKAATEMKSGASADAQAEAEKIISNAKKTIEAEKEKAITEVRQELTDLTVSATEKILQKKMDEKNDQEYVKKIITGINHE